MSEFAGLAGRPLLAAVWAYLGAADGAVDAAAARLAAARAAVAAGAAAAAGVNALQAADAVLALDVGGRAYAVARRTLTAAGADAAGLLAVLADGAFADEADPATGRVFVDRDGAPFAHVLAALRWWPRPYPGVQPGCGAAVRRELRYYAVAPARAPVRAAADDGGATYAALVLGAIAARRPGGGARYAVTDAYGAVLLARVAPPPPGGAVEALRLRLAAAVPADGFLCAALEAVDAADGLHRAAVYARTGYVETSDRPAPAWTTLRAPAGRPAAALTAAGTRLALRYDTTTGAVSAECDGADRGPVYALPPEDRLRDVAFVISASRGCVVDVLGADDGDDD